MSSYVRFEKVSKVYQTGEVELMLKGVSFDIEEGEVCHCGQSGAGKTTLLIFWVEWIQQLPVRYFW